MRGGALLSPRLSHLTIPRYGQGPPLPSAQRSKLCYTMHVLWHGTKHLNGFSCCPLQVINVTPRYARLKAADKKQVIGWENIELISDRPLETMLQEFRQLKAEYPNR